MRKAKKITLIITITVLLIAVAYASYHFGLEVRDSILLKMNVKITLPFFITIVLIALLLAIISLVMILREEDDEHEKEEIFW